MEQNSSSFSVYRYQLLPTAKYPQLSLKFGYEDIDELKRDKNSIFRNSLIDQSLNFISNSTLLVHKILQDQNQVIVLRLGAERLFDVDTKEFQKEKLTSYPNTLIIIDNRPDVQKIYIENNRKAFTSTDAVVNIVSKTIDKYLRRYDLAIYILPIFSKKDFWSITKEFENRIEYISFEFIRPNISNISHSLNQNLKEAQAETNAPKATLKLSAPKNGSLDVTPENDTVNGLVDYSAKGGGEIKVKIKKFRKTFSTKETQTTVELDGVEIQGTTSENALKILDSLRNLDKD